MNIPYSYDADRSSVIGPQGTVLLLDKSIKDELGEELALFLNQRQQLKEYAATKDPDKDVSTPCACCQQYKAKEGSSEYCVQCWSDIVEPAYKHVNAEPSYGEGPRTFVGATVREAFIAGAASMIKKSRTSVVAMELALINDLAYDICNTKNPCRGLKCLLKADHIRRFFIDGDTRNSFFDLLNLGQNSFRLFSIELRFTMGHP